METKNFLRSRIGLLHEAVDAEHEHARRKIREYGLTEIFTGAGAALFGLRLYL